MRDRAVKVKVRNPGRFGSVWEPDTYLNIRYSDIACFFAVSSMQAMRAGQKGSKS